MRKDITIRIPRRVLRTALILAISAFVIAPIAVSASHQFTDVPDTNVFHDNIGWMSDNGITAGCNPPDFDEYCPKDNVTREQMAAFMQRLAEGKVVDAATAVSAESADDADMLDGLDANQLSRVAYAVATNDAWVGDGTNGDILTTTINAPIDGFLVISASSDVFSYSVDDSPGCAIELNDAVVSSSRRQIEVNGTGSVNREEDCSTQTVVPVMAGDHEVSFVTTLSPATGVTYDESALTVMFVPFDAQGNPPTDFTVNSVGLESAND